MNGTKPAPEYSRPLRVPLTPASRGDPSGVQCFRDFSQGSCASLLRFADDRQDIRGVAVSLGVYSLNGVLAGRMEPRVAKGHPASLSSGKGLLDPCGDGARRPMNLGGGRPL